MKSGIKKIRGQITVNRDLITDIPENTEWLWYDLGNYYGAGCYSLNFMENAVKIYLQEQTRSGKICDIVKVIPSILEDKRFDPRCTSRTKVYLYWAVHKMIFIQYTEIYCAVEEIQ